MHNIHKKGMFFFIFFFILLVVLPFTDIFAKYNVLPHIFFDKITVYTFFLLFKTYDKKNYNCYNFAVDFVKEAKKHNIKAKLIAGVNDYKINKFIAYKKYDLTDVNNKKVKCYVKKYQKAHMIVQIYNYYFDVVTYTKIYNVIEKYDENKCYIE